MRNESKGRQRAMLDGRKIDKKHTEQMVIKYNETR